MSLRWKSELDAVLGPERCEVSISPGLFGTRVAAHGEGIGNSPGAITLALQALVASGQPMLPRRARLTVPDERVYFAMLPAASPWSRRLEVATRHLVESLGRQDLRVQISLVDAGRSWLVAAIEEADRQAWAQAFSEAGVALLGIQPALTRDLLRIASEVPTDGVLVLIRREGVMLLLLRAGELTDLRWERCSEAEFEQRVEAFVESVRTDAEPLPVVVFVDEYSASDAISGIATAHRWRELRAVPAPQPSECVA